MVLCYDTFCPTKQNKTKQPFAAVLLFVSSSNLAACGRAFDVLCCFGGWSLVWFFSSCAAHDLWFRIGRSNSRPFAAVLLFVSSSNLAACGRAFDVLCCFGGWPLMWFFSSCAAHDLWLRIGRTNSGRFH